MPNDPKTKTIQIGQDRGPGDDRALAEPPTQVLTDVVVGTLTIVEGPGAGQSLPVYKGSNQIGRSPDSRIQIDFGDATISRVQHAVMVYDADTRVFTIVDGGKPNPVMVNGERLTGIRSVVPGDTIRIGLTMLRLSV